MTNMLINTNLSFAQFSSFFLGIGVGFLLMLLIYVYAVIKSLKKGLKTKNADVIDINEEEIKWLIEDARKRFKNKKQRKERGYGNHLYDVSKDLAFDIASKFYPKSKYPYLELTVDETLVLAHYVTNRLDELFKSKLLKLLRGVTLRRIAEFNDTKTKIEKTKVVKSVKKYKVVNVISNTVKALNVVNPLSWFKRLTFDQAIQIILIKIGLAVVSITGEETYKIYSKSVFNEEKTIDSDLEDALNRMNDLSDEEDE